MWVEKTRNGIRLCERFTGPDGRQHRASVPLTKDTAQARKIAAAALMDKIKDGQVITGGSTVSAAVEEYLRRIDVKGSTLRAYSLTLGSVSDLLEDVQVARLSAPMIKRSLAASGKSPKTLNRYINVFNTFLIWAHDFGYIPEPLHVSRFPDKSPRRDPALEYLEREELEHVLAQVEGSQYYYIIKFLALSGCRVGELSALTPEDIDGRYVHISKTWSAADGFSTPKTASSVRDIFITPELADLLRAFKEWRLLYIMAHKIRPATLFFSVHGNPISASRLCDVLHRLDSPKHLHPHILRHTHVSLLAEQGVSLETISRRLGHATSATTKAIYFHVTKKLKARDEEILSRVSIL